MSEIDSSVERLESGDAWSDDDQVVELRARQPLDKVIPVRLSTQKWDEIRLEAHELGVGPSTLARMWILERLREIRKARAPESAAGQRDPQ